MGLRRLIFRFSGFVGVHWHLNRRILLWLIFSVAVGVVVGLFVMFNPLLTASKISKHLIDANLERTATPNAGLGGMIFGRVFDFAAAALMIFVVCLTNWSALFVFPLAAFEGFCVVMNLYWILGKFGMVTGLVLFIAYLFWLVILLTLFVIMTVFIMRYCVGIRRYGFRAGIKWREFFRGFLILCTAAAIIGFFEWIIYFLVLSRMVFLV